MTDFVFGIVGVGMEGTGLLTNAVQLPGVECAAACDLYDGRHELAREIVGKPIKTTRHYKELLDDKEIDAIIIAVPDRRTLYSDTTQRSVVTWRTNRITEKVRCIGMKLRRRLSLKHCRCLGRKRVAMKFHRIVLALAAILSLFPARNLFAAKPTKETSAAPADSAAAFLGRWDLTLKAADREYPSWLELSEENGQLKAQMVGRWGNARPLPKVELSNGQLTFVSPKDEEALPQDMVFEGTLSGARLSGTVTGRKDCPWHWTGQKAPALKAKSDKWGKSIALFNGKDLTGWKMRGEGTSKWTVENGNLVSPGNGPELINDSKFEDFKLHVEFNCGPASNSGVYLRGRYEVQIETDSAEEPPSHHTGGVYGFLAGSPEPPRKSDEWQALDITLTGRWITVAQNGKTIIDNQEIPGITGGALDSHEELPGPIYLQGSEKGHVLFRSIVIRPAAK